MTFITGGNNPNNNASVDAEGRLNTFSVVVTEQQDAAIQQSAYNVNTDEITLTDDLETPIFYIRNVGEARAVKLSRVFLTALESTGGVGPVRAAIYYNITGGSILTAPELPIFNFNAGSANIIDVDVRKGASGDTFVGGTTPIKFLFPSANFRSLTQFDNIVLPRGSSALFTIKPPTGNTSMITLSGTNTFLSEFEI